MAATRDWSNLPSELLDLVIKKLSFTNINTFKSVCSYWHSTALSHLFSPSYRRSHTPWLILRTHQEDGDGGFGFFNLEDKTIYRAKNLLSEELCDNLCFSSSRGWLLLCEKNTGNLFLLNPLSGNRVHLPSIITFPCILRRWDFKNGLVFLFDNNGNSPSSFLDFRFLSTKYPTDHFISKAVLLSEPHLGAMVVLYGVNKYKLAFWRYGDSVWTQLEGKHRFYCDIICNDQDELYALANNGSIEVWDFNTCDAKSGIKKRDIEASLPENIECSRGHIFSNKFYLVKAPSGDFLLVVRNIAEFVNWDGKALSESDFQRYADLPYQRPKFYPYKTLKFMVFRLDLKQKKWVEVQDLGNSVLFLGGSHSISVSAKDSAECEENSIYFTDDNWSRMNEDSLYGGHDTGVFNLKDGSVKQFFQGGIRKFEKEFFRREMGKFEPAPFWVVPNL